MKVSAYSEEYAEFWDEFVARAPMATFLHSRRFLSYHGDRFQDVSLVIEGEGNSLLGLFPAAADPTHSKRVISHPGITYGGLIHGRELHGEKVLGALQAVTHYYADMGFESLRYKAIPYIYHRAPSSDDLYALFRLGAMRYRCDLSCAIDLAGRRDPTQRRKRGLKKALKRGIEIEQGPRFAGPLWQVLEENLAKKYGARPVHSLDEILNLHSSFPKSVEFVVAMLHSEVVAGVVLFSTGQVMHAQYAASNTKGYESSALDRVFEHCIREAQMRGMRYFDLGISNEQGGIYLNAQLYEFKAEFGGGGVVHEFYEYELRS